MGYSTFHEAYLHNLSETYTNPQFINMPRGHRSLERLNMSFIIDNPIERVCYLKTRKTNIIFNYAEFLWYLSGKNDLEFINYYAPNINKYSADKATLPGTGYGAKIFSYGSEKIDQWDRLIQLFKEDRDTKRAFLAIFDANENLSLDNIDVSCTIGLHFFIRNDLLFATSFMRANDAYVGILSDVFSFTLIQELLATQLGLGLGNYCHNVATTHIYDNNIENVKKVLQEKNAVFECVFPAMPLKDNWSDIKIVLEYEALLRKNAISLDLMAINNIEIDHYWKQVLLLFSLYQQITFKMKIDNELFLELDPIFQYFLKNRWSTLF